MSTVQQTPATSKPETHTLTLQTYLNAFRGYCCAITGGVLDEFLRNSRVAYYGGRCPCWYIEYWHNGRRIVISGNYATNGKPVLQAHAPLDFV